VRADHLPLHDRAFNRLRIEFGGERVVRECMDAAKERCGDRDQEY
jgi:hypothetical protein